jgi:hypothetical protein
MANFPGGNHLIHHCKHLRIVINLGWRAELGRRLSPHVADGYNASNLNAFVDRSRENLQTGTVATNGRSPPR